MFNDEKYYRNVGQGNKKIGSKDEFLNNIKDQKKKEENKNLKEEALKIIKTFMSKL